MPDPDILSCRDLTKRYSGRVALPPVSFSVMEGEHLAIVGPSGSGKTTLVRLLAGLLDPTGGAVFDRGILVNRPGWRLEPHLRNIGVLFQGLALWPHLTVREQVRFAMPPGGSSRAERNRAVERLLEAVGISALSGRLPQHLSGGEKQRVAWARAVAGSPRLLFLDEPLTSLDPALREELLLEVIRYGESPGHTIIIVTHDSGVARRVGGRLLELGRASPGGPGAA